MNLKSDEYFMRMALSEAGKALEHDEVPVGAIVVHQNKILARGYNQVEMLKDATAHAEMIALTAAGNALNSKYLDRCTIYVSLEPCPMCAAAMNWAQIGRLVYAAGDPNNGFKAVSKKLLHPKTKCSNGIFKEESAQLLKEFFSKKRA